MLSLSIPQLGPDAMPQIIRDGTDAIGELVFSIGGRDIFYLHNPLNLHLYRLSRSQCLGNTCGQSSWAAIELGIEIEMIKCPKTTDDICRIYLVDTVFPVLEGFNKPTPLKLE